MSASYGRKPTITLAEDEVSSLQATINPILPAAQARSLSTSEVGLTLPSVENLPTLDINLLDGDTREFELQEIIGEGGMGLVRTSYQRTLRRHVVVKHPHESDPISNQTKALVKEGILTGFLEHPNIVPVHFLGKMPNGMPALVMKRIAGSTWKEVLANPNHTMWDKVPQDHTAWKLRVLLQVCNAVEFAHSQNVIHRDIKPENIMLGDFGEVYLLDWGIGLKLDSEEQTQHKHFAGTPAYMAPEMLLGTVSKQTDQYLLGATLHELLTGEQKHNAKTLDKVIWQAQRSAPHKYPPSIPKELAAICNRATHKDPEARYPSVRAFREAIEQHLEHRNALSLTQSAIERQALLTAQIEKGLQEITQDTRLYLHQLATECRFALQEALRIWPNSTQAKQSLQECITSMATIELAQGNHASAELLMAELELVPDPLQTQLDALKEKEKETLAAQSRLKQMEAQLDNRVGLHPKSWIFAALSLAIMTVATSYNLYTGEWIVKTPQGGLITGAFVIAISILVCLIYRDVLSQTTLNKQMTFSYFMGCTGVLLNRSLPFFFHTPVELAFVVDLIIAGAVFGIAGFTQEKRLLWGTFYCFSFMIVGIIRPSWAYMAMCLGLGLSVLSVSSIWLYEEHKITTDTQEEGR